MSGTTNANPNQQPSLLQLPWKTRISLFFLNTFTDASRRDDGTVNRSLFRLLGPLSLKTPPSPTKPSHGVVTSDVVVDPSRNLWLRLFVPTTTSEKLPVVVFFHGGGFVYLAPDFKAYDYVCRRFALKVPAVVVSVNYRLAPEHKYPAQYEDGFDVLEFLDRGGGVGGGVLPENADLSRCILAGDSAGANLSHHVAKRACESDSKFTRIKVKGVVAIQPFFGGEERTKSEIELADVDVMVSTTKTDFMWNAFMREGMDRDHEVINVSGPRAADISKLDFPATLVVVAGFDSLKDWQMRYYEWLKKSGKEAYLVEYPTMFHAFYVFPELPESAQLVSEVKNFIHRL